MKTSSIKTGTKINPGKTSFFGIFLMLIALLLLSQAAAASSSDIYMPYQPYSGNSFGSNQYYSAVFDGEGEAMVLAKLEFQNFDTVPIRSINIEIPGNIRIINILQEAEEKQQVCAEYEKPECPDNYYCMYKEQPKLKCVRWSDSITKKYYAADKTLQLSYNSARLNLVLPKEVNSQEKTSILLYYKSDSYTEESFGTYNFDFRTIKTNFDVNSIRVAINTADGLYLKGSTAKTNYVNNYGLAAFESASMKEGIVSRDLESFSSQLEYTNGYVKSTQNIDPHENFEVKGQYSESWILLYSGRIILGIAGFFGFILFVLFFLSRIKDGRYFQSAAAVGFISSVAIMLTWICAFFVGSRMLSWISYRYETFFALLLILITTITTLTLLIAPPIYIGKRDGMKQGFIVLGSIIIFLVVFAVVGIAIMGVIGGGFGNNVIY